MSSSNRGAAWVWVCGFVIFVVGALAFLTAPGSRGSFRRLARHVGDALDRASYSEWRWTDERGELRYMRYPDGRDEVSVDGEAVAPADFSIENDTVTVWSVKDAEGELLYDRVPFSEEADRRVRATDAERRLGVRFERPRESGAEPRELRVRRVVPAEPGSTVALEPGDTIVGIAGEHDASLRSLRRALGPLIPGGTLHLTIRRADASRDLAIDLPSLLPLDDWRQLAEPR